MEKQPQLHTIAPVYDENSRILILGSFPSVKSREAAFFYGHPQNRFWRVLAALFDEPVPEDNAERSSNTGGIPCSMCCSGWAQSFMAASLCSSRDGPGETRTAACARLLR